MIVITERATAALEQILLVNGAERRQGVKLVPDLSGRIGLTIATPDKGDEVIGSADEPLLIVDSRIKGKLDGSELDCEMALVQGEEVSEFHLRPAA
ncbi:MAG TPA: hypothetical protein VGK54_07015 [Chloroflexota bacterium]